MTETENQNVQKPEEMNNQNNNIKNEIRQRNAVLILSLNTHLTLPTNREV